GAQCIFCYCQPHTLHREKLRVLLDHRVFSLGQNRHHLFLRKSVERAYDRQSPYEFRNHSESEQVFRFDMSDGLLPQCFLDFESRATKAHHFLADTFLNNLIQPDEGAAANEEDFFSVDLDVFLVRVLAPALWRNVAGAALQNLQKCLLNAFARDIAGNAHVIGFAPDLVDLVDVNDSDLGSFHVVIGILQESQNDLLDIFTDIAGFGQRGRICDTEWHVENPGQRFSQQSFTGAGGSDEQNVALLDFNFRKWIRLECRGYVGRRRSLQDALVMVVQRHRKRLFGD